MNNNSIKFIQFKKIYGHIPSLQKIIIMLNYIKYVICKTCKLTGACSTLPQSLSSSSSSFFLFFSFLFIFDLVLEFESFHGHYKAK
jgi:hypothetical protein